ncbi:unnamed protein product [Polarella glacialis]|uniref:Uncharacterized protein n=1 Tax=Polarella glacialis TaxID=89957 RepID=A0A813KWZ8_POLGL|nr:unnamed protein product [Polarella glacialis]
MVAYLWLVVIVQVNTPDVVEVWEAVVTIMFLPTFSFVSYLADIGYIAGVRKLPPVERPVGLYVESGASPVAADSHSYQQVWRQQLRRAKSPELAGVEGPAASFQHGFFDPGAITDKKGKPLGDPAGILSFPDDTWEVSCGLQGREFSVPVFRKNGSHGLVRCRYRTDGRTAIPGYDFVTSEGELTWEHGETLAQVTVQFLPKELGEHSDQHGATPMHYTTSYSAFPPGRKQICSLNGYMKKCYSVKLNCISLPANQVPGCQDKLKQALIQLKA